MKEYVWKRRPLPDGHTPHSLYWGWGLIAFGIAGFMVALTMSSEASETYSYDAIEAAEASVQSARVSAASGFMVSIGIGLSFLGAIVTELRRKAFEAALRAGEVHVIDMDAKTAPAVPIKDNTTNDTRAG